MKRILLDCDGVLADFIGGVCDALDDLFGVADPLNGEPARMFTPEQVTEFDFCKGFALSSDEKRAIMAHISKSPDFWRNLVAFPEAVDGVRRLREVADVYIVTSPWNSCRTWLSDREWWLRDRFDIPHSRVIACSAKHLVSGDMLVDDKTSTLVEWDNEQSASWVMPDSTAGTTFAVQWETPHNRRDGWTGHSTRSWQQLLEWAK